MNRLIPIRGEKKKRRRDRGRGKEGGREGKKKCQWSKGGRNGGKGKQSKDKVKEMAKKHK